MLNLYHVFIRDLFILKTFLSSRVKSTLFHVSYYYLDFNLIIVFIILIQFNLNFILIEQFCLSLNRDKIKFLYKYYTGIFNQINIFNKIKFI